MDVRGNKAQAEKLMRALIKQMKTQVAVAKALGCSRQRFNYWFNHANEVPYDQLLSMQKLLEKLEAKHHSQTSFSLQTTQPEINALPKALTISERVKQAMAFEQSLILQRGRPTKLNAEIRRTCDTFLRKAEIVAKKFDFNSKDSYLRAKKVVLRGIPALTQAMDDELIAIYHAAQLTQLPAEQITALLAKGKVAVTAYLKKQKTTSIHTRKQTCFISAHVYHSEKLVKAEQTYQLPLRLLFTGLLMVCDKAGTFPWQPEKLALQIAPFIAIDFNTVLDALTTCGLITKTGLTGRILDFKALTQEVNHATLVS